MQNNHIGVRNRGSLRKHSATFAFAIAETGDPTWCRSLERRIKLLHRAVLPWDQEKSRRDDSATDVFDSSDRIKFRKTIDRFKFLGVFALRTLRASVRQLKNAISRERNSYACNLEC